MFLVFSGRIRVFSGRSQANGAFNRRVPDSSGQGRGLALGLGLGLASWPYTHSRSERFARRRRPVPDGFRPGDAAVLEPLLEKRLEQGLGFLEPPVA